MRAQRSAGFSHCAPRNPGRHLLPCYDCLLFFLLFNRFNHHLDVICFFICGYFTKLTDSDHGNHENVIGWILVFELGFVKIPTTSSADRGILLAYVRVRLPHD